MAHRRPRFADGLAVQAVLDAVQRSALLAGGDATANPSGKAADA
jgi:hypothetical protein